MNILAFVDTHGSISAIDRLRKRAKNADIIVCAGDITVFERDLLFFLNRLNDFGKRVLIIHGNHEAENVMRKACEAYENIEFIHDKIVDAGNARFYGWGGGGFAMDDREFEKRSKRVMKDIKPGTKLVLVAHAPPYKTKLDSINGDHNGNKSFTAFIKKNRPKLVVCGHFHENAGKQDKLSSTLIVNPGPKGMILKI